MAARRVFLLIEHNIFREALALALNETLDLEVVSQVGSLAEMGSDNLEHNIDVALLEPPLSEGEALAAIRKLSTHHADAVVLVLGSDLDPSGIVRALGAGAAGVLSTSSSLEEIVQAIRSSAGRDRPIATHQLPIALWRCSS